MIAIFKKKNIKKLIAMILTVIITFTSVGLENLTGIAEAATSYTTLYLVDDTPEHWIGNDNAVIEMVDNTYGHDRYIMKKETGNMWSVRVPSTTFNVTFNRLSPDRKTQWNSWSAGGRNTHSTYHAITHEHGYWDGNAVLEEGFHEGDIIYLDYYEFNDWKKSDALFYVNFTSASKEDNNGYDININSADSSRFKPIRLVNEIEEDVFTYTVTAEDEGAKELRFWRGNSENLWNCSVTLSYSDYKAGNNCAKIQGWNDIGYVCPYVPRRHITQIDSIELNVSGNMKVNRKINADLNIQGEVDLLLKEETVITIEKTDENNEEEDSEQNYILYDESKTTWNHRELIFKEAGTYHITATATDGVDSFTTDTYVTIVNDEAPKADFAFKNYEQLQGQNAVYLRDSQGTAHIAVDDMSVSELGDDITTRVFSLYYDADNNGEFGEDELISMDEGSYELKSVGKYMIKLYVKETYTDTIPELLEDSDYLDDEICKTFEIVNQAPESSMYIEKSKIADIIFTVGNADRDILNSYVNASEKVEAKLNELGINAKVSTVSTSALTAQDTFAWTEYDHYNYADSWLPTLPKHITYDGNDIKMIGYSRAAIKDFLYIDDSDSSRKVFEFDLQRDYNNWHSMEGGGFLFNTKVSEEENYIQGYCILVTSSGLRLVQINKVNLNSFRNGSYNNVYQAGKLLQTFPMQNLYDEHHFKIIIDKNIVTVYDDDKLLIDEYVLPDDGVDAYGYGPLISHASHNCGQQSYFTFKNIVMQTITGESLSDVVNNHEWTPGTNHYVINLSETSVPELSDKDRMSDVAAAMIRNDAMFFGIGNQNTMEQYNILLNTLEGEGENIELSDDIAANNAVDQIVARITADINSKDYNIGYTIATDEEVVYLGTYNDPENDPVGAEEWKYNYDASVFGENIEELQGIQEIVRSTPITMFTKSGAYEISRRISDNPTGGNSALDSYIKWSDTDDYKKLILSQHRPTASVNATVTQSPTDSGRCMVNVIYESEDADHPSDERKGIRDEKFYYKEMGDTEWTEGKFPAEVEMGTTYLIKYITTDIEGTVSRPGMAVVKTSEARVYVEPDDTTPPVIDLMVSAATVEVGETFYIEASASDDYGVVDFTVNVNGENIGTSYGRYDFTAENAGEAVITVTAIDIVGNTSTETKTVSIVDKSDVIPPTISITSPKNGTVTGNVDIIGSIKDNRQLKSYIVTMQQVNSGEDSDDGANASTGSGDEINPVVLAEGTEEIINDVIATVETDGLEGGVFKIDIKAEDMSGLTSTVTLLITVEETISDRIPPLAEITDIILNNDLNEIEVSGSVSDETALGGYKLIMYSSQNNSNKTVIAQGTESLSNELIGEISEENLESGIYTLELLAWDEAGNTCVSSAEFTYTKGSSGTEDNGELERDSDVTPPVISGELNASITQDGLKLILNGTVSDENLKEYTVITGRFYGNTILSPMVVAKGNENIINDIIAGYTYSEFSEGDYAVEVTATDNAGNKRTALYTVKITKNGTIDDGYTGEDNNGEDPDNPNVTGLNLVLSCTSANTTDTVKAYMTYPENATDVTLTADGAEVTVYGRTADIKTDAAGEITVTLSAIIGGETKTVSQKVRFFDKSDSVHPVAYFITPESDSTIKSKTEITGTVFDETSLAYYTLEYRMEGTNEYRLISKGTEPVMEGVLGELDTTMLENGRYLLRLTGVDNGGNRIRVERSINVEGNLKVGNMNLSFTDINANVSGIPLIVTRSYDSRNKSSGDFGTGWRLGMQSVKLTESSDITTGYKLVQQGTQLSTGYYMTQTACHDVTVTYGDGTSDRFELKLSPERQGLIPIYEVEVTFLCVTDKSVKLELNGDNHALVYGSQLIFEDDNLFENISYILTKKDGTKLYLDSVHGLLKMEDTNRNTVSVSKNGFKHSDGNGVTFTRDSKGRIIKAVEKGNAGNIITSMTYAYDNSDNLINVTDGAGRTVAFTYDDEHNLIDIIDPSGIAIARNIYDDSGRLTATIDADGNRIEYDHDIEGKTETVRDKMGNVTVYTYDDNGNILQTVDALGNVTRSTYDENNNVLTKTDAKGNTTSYSYDSDNNLKTVTSAAGTTQTLGYNTLNIVNSISLADSIIATMDYDSSGNLTQMTDSLGNETELSYEGNGKLKGITDSIGTVESLTYDSAGNLTTMTDGNGNVTKYTYDSEGKCSSVTVKRTDSDGVEREYTSTYIYDSAGNVTAVISPSGQVTGYEYDFRNNRTAQISPDGKRTQYTYDSMDNLTLVTYPDGTTEEFTYDLNGNNITATSRMGVTVSFEYDKLNRLKKKTYSDGTHESYTYDANGNVLTHTSVTGGITTYAYDCMDRNTAITDAYGNTTQFQYNERSLLTKTIDALGNTFEYVYDANGNQTKIIYPDDTTEKTEYDVRNRVTKRTDRNGNITEYTYDSADNLTSVKDAAGGIYTYEYDETYELTKVTDAKGNETCYEYDADGRLIKITNSAGSTSEFIYDSNGYNTGYKDYAGNETEYTYNDDGRLSKVSDNDGDTVYNYDNLGRLVTVTDAQGVINYAYDVYGRLSSKTTYNYGTIRYTYNASDDISSITTNVNGADVGTTSYEYDLMNRIIRVVGHDGSVTLYEYDAIGNRTAVKHEGGLTVTYEYDECSRLVKEIVKDTDGYILMYYGYTYGNAGEKTKAVEAVRESKDDTHSRVIVTSYTYDRLLRLTTEEISINDNVDIGNNSGVLDENILDISGVTWSGNIKNQYVYDAVSNRVSKTTTVTGNVCGLDDKLQTGITTYTYNNLNQLKTSENGGIVTTYTYDINGNLVSEHGGNEDKTYTYNAKNRLVTATVSSGNNVTIESYTYDYEGNRLSKQTNEDEKTYYLNDTYESLTQVALELKKSNDGKFTVSKYYTRGTELISADILCDDVGQAASGNEDAGSDSVIHKYKKKLYIMDGHGSVTALAESQITDTYIYDAYGNLLKQTGTTDNDYLYTGEQYNAATGLYYLRARYMNPETGTFTSMDSYAGTLDNPVSLHKYLYANANPVMYTDPSGYFSLAECSVVQGIQSTLNSVIVPYFNIKKIMSWANLAVTMYDVAQQVRLILSGEANILGLAIAIAQGMITQALLNCAMTAVLGEAAATILKIVGIAQDTASFIEAVKSGDPEKIIVESLRLAVSLFTLKCQCFTGETLVSTEDGDRRIDEIKAGDYVWAYDTETDTRTLRKVLDVSVTQTDVLVHVFTSEGEDIETTMFHPFYVQDSSDDKDSQSGRWVAVSNLVSGDKLLTEDGRIVYVDEVRIEKLAENINVYNLEVEELHTYFVAGGVLVHNRCKLGKNMAEEKPFGIEDPGKGYDAHHIFPQAFRDFFEGLGIDIDAAEFGIWVDSTEHKKSAGKYNKKWEQQINIWKKIGEYSIEDVFEFMNTLDRLW